MNTMKIGDGEFNLLRKYIEEQCGISIPDDKRYLIETRLTKLVVETASASFQEFYLKVVGNRDPKLRERIVDAMTTNETLWFRDSAPWAAFRQKLLPALADLVRASPGRKIRIWSAACSTGQEPYSIAMLIDDFCTSALAKDVTPAHFEILATDISPSALFIAMSGRYDKISMNRGFDGDWLRFKGRYFKDAGRAAELSPAIRGRVKFQKYNLQDDFGPLGRFDLVLMRNVAIYFSDAFKRQIYDRLAKIIAPGGGLVLGSAETLVGYSTRFKTEDHGRAVVYRLVG
jgi:chemotaxis protein methyltransferase CheR